MAIYHLAYKWAPCICLHGTILSLPQLHVHAWRSSWMPLTSLVIWVRPQPASVYCYSNLGSRIKWRNKVAPLQERKMVDIFRVSVQGGDGGDGCTSFRKSRHSRYGFADGGNGGKGGDVILECSSVVWDFSHLQHHHNAKRGGLGSSKRRIGCRADDKVVQVPVGTVIYLLRGSIPAFTEENCRIESFQRQVDSKDSMEEDCELSAFHSQSVVDVFNTDCGSNGERSCSEVINTDNESLIVEENCEDRERIHIKSYEDDGEYNDDDTDSTEEQELLQVTKRSVAELIAPGQTLIVASGGEGGRGNAAMARGLGSQKSFPSREHENGRPGTQAVLVLELKTIADVGLVGAPNAGKSTLLGAMSRAKPRVGHYAFTTLRPNLGKLEFEDFFSLTIADIPGILKGAHQNRGLGHDFLRHIERTKVLAYVLDLAAGLGDKNGLPPWDQLEELKFELEMYQSGLSERPALVIANKIDEEGAVEVLQELKRRHPSMQIFPICAVLEEGIEDLRIGMRKLVDGLYGGS